MLKYLFWKFLFGFPNGHDTLIKAELYFKFIFLEKQQIENPNMYFSIHSTLLTTKTQTRTQQPTKAHYLLKF